MQAADQPITVLLVDDHTLFRSGVRSLLQRHPEFSVVGEAADGVEGIKRAQQLKPQVVLLDLNMPFMNGFEVLEGLKEVEAGEYLPVLAVTAAPEHKQRALDAGVMDFICKPFDHCEVLARIRNLLE
eukprot:gene26641-30108_t